MHHKLMKKPQRSVSIPYNKWESLLNVQITSITEATIATKIDSFKQLVNAQVCEV